VTGRRVERLRRALSIGEAPASGAIRDQTTSVALIGVYGLRVGLTLGIVFLMTVQPDFVPSVIALVSAAAIGVLATIPAAAGGRRAQPPDVRTA
jgi:hypothetical protein